MANVSSQSTRTSGRAQNYAKKDSVAISAINASVPMFEKRLAEIRAAHGKDGLRPKAVLDENGRPVRDEHGNPVIEKDAKGRTLYESKYVEAYSLVESFGHDELDPSDPESWVTAQRLGRALAEDRFPGHPVLVATEVNGRSGCVHNHLIVGAVHPETGKSIDSNVVTHARLALAHDRVLAEQGFEQRADMKAKSLAAEQAMADARAAVTADPANKDLSPSQLQRKLTAAENSVRFEREAGVSATQVRQDRRLREFARYQLNERDRMIAADIGAVPPKEKFSEIELESRIRQALSDPRFRSWDEVAKVGREHGVTIAERGKDVSFGMMLAQPDGTIAEPARAHMRRGGRPGSGKGLGDGFRREDVEAAIERNVREHEQQTAQQQLSPASGAGDVQTLDIERKSRDQLLAEARSAVWEQDVDTSFLDTHRRDSHSTNDAAVEQLQDFYASDEFTAEVERLRAEQERATAQRPSPVPAAERSAPEDQPVAVPEALTEPVVEENQEPAFRSRIRDVRATTDAMQTRVDQLGPFEERWHGALPSTPQARREFEQQAAAIGIGQKALQRVEGHMERELYDYLSQRVKQAEQMAKSEERRQKLLQDLPTLKAQAAADPLNLRDSRSKWLEARADIRFETEYFTRMAQDREAGVYASRRQERMEHLEKKTLDRAADLQRTDVQERLSEDIDKLGRDRTTRDRDRGEDRGYDMEMG